MGNGGSMSLLANLVKSQQVVSLPPITSVTEATKTMALKNVGSVVVLDQEKLVGIFSERDLLNRVISKGLDPQKTLLSHVMSTAVCTVNLLDTVEHCFNKMQTTKCRHLPIINGPKVVGMVTMRNILEWLVEEMGDENIHLKQYIQS